MAIVINGTGTITGISAGGLPDGVITTDDIAANAVTSAKLGTTEQSRLCRAWVNFDGTGTVAIRGSYNVSSITDNGTGDYTVNFTTAMADANYSVAACGSNYQGYVVGYGVVGGFGRGGSISASSFRMFVVNNSNTSVDENYVFVSIFR